MILRAATGGERRTMFPSRVASILIALFILVAWPGIGAAQPGAATGLTSADGGSYTFTWNRVTGATHYYVWANEAGVPKIQKWFTSTETKCAASEATCSVSIATPPIAAGSQYWWVQTYSSTTGYGPWSASAFWLSRPPSEAIVVDSQGRYIGTLHGDNYVLLNVAGLPARAQINSATGFSANTLSLFFTTTDCSGQKYGSNVIPDRIEFTNNFTSAFLTRGIPAVQNIVRVRSYESNGNIGTCDVSVFTDVVTPVNFVNMSTLATFTTPFSVVR
jgi:hypothetical protein